MDPYLKDTRGAAAPPRCRAPCSDMTVGMEYIRRATCSPISRKNRAVSSRHATARIPRDVSRTASELVIPQENM